MIKLGKYYDLFITFVIFIKVLFVIFAILTKYYKSKITNAPHNKELLDNYNWVNYWKEKLELLFIIIKTF